MTKITDINKNEIAILRTNDEHNEADIEAYIDNGETNNKNIPVLNHQGLKALYNIQVQAQADQANNDESNLDIDSDDEQHILGNPDNSINGIRDGFINLPYSSVGDIITESYGSFVHYQTENDYSFDIADDCGSKDEELGEMLYESLKDEYHEDRLGKYEIYYNTLKSLDSVYTMDSYGNIGKDSMSNVTLAHKFNGTDDNITIHAHNNAKSRQHISKLVKLLNPGFYDEWKHVLEPKAKHADPKVIE